MADDEKKTATIKLYRDNVPRITITYKGKKDLFRKFQKKISEMDLSNDEIYWADWDNDRSVVKTADDLFAAVENNSTVRMYVRTDANSREKEVISCPSSDDEEEEKREEEAEEKKETRNRSPSPDRARGRSRSEPHRHRSRSHSEPSYDQMPWNFAPWNFGYGPMPFYYDPRAHGKGRRGRNEKRGHKCCCQDMCKDFANL
ncbi:hypothetical protein Y032_0112g289 [Ancylostoma ceylanicum]|uniref:PB1 domain-containing protein n=1 Tax=Ancylostoma ceylanicum TaxID=53326 RepID=A0A016TDR6_9BILA|nr:hypothetical protein Y032_0112g289 [Ancylostoma ceylanicum]